MNIISNDNINLTRKRILMKGYANISDIRNFMPCGYERARKIFNQERAKEAAMKKVTLRGIEAKKLLPLVFLTEYEINQYAAEEERRVECNTTK